MTESALQTLLRWVDKGGRWEAEPAAGGRVRVVLITCDGGERVDAFTSDDPELLAYLATQGEGS